MPHELLQGLVVWLPTLLFFLSLLFYFLTGVIRGFRKSTIFLIHATASLTVCAVVFFVIVRSENIDTTMVGIVNKFLGGNSIQNIMGVDESLTSMKDILLDMVLNGMSNEEVFYYVIIDAGVYISTVVELLYRMILFILLWVVHLVLIFILTIIYHIFYPVRRKVRRHKKMFENGDVSAPYRKRRLFGGLVGVGRGLVANIFILSFVGCLLWLVTGEAKPLPDRQEGTTEEITFGNDTADIVYDYYSALCKSADAGIFKALNAIKDPDDVPYYFYICDLMLQGGIEDPTLGVSDTFYLRRELGAYLGFCKNSVALFVKYAGSDIKEIIDGENSTEILTEVIKNENFVNEFSTLIDEFKKQPFLINLGLCVITSFVNHMDLLLGPDNVLAKMVMAIFDKENGIKITDLATEQDIKGLIKSFVGLASTALTDMENQKLAKKNALMSEEEQQSFDIKLAFKYGSTLINDIQSLSIFNERKDIGNKFISIIYNFCVEELVKDSVDLPAIDANSWMDEFNILFDSVEYILAIGAEIFDPEMNNMISNLFTMFDGENGEKIEGYWDSLVSQLTKSKLLDVVFRSTVPGQTIDGLIQSMTGNPEAAIPKKFTISSSETSKGELEIILNCVKVMIKNDFKRVFEIFSSGTIGEPELREMFEILNKDINPSEEKEETIFDELLESKLLRYALSSFMTYSNFGDINLYITDSASEKVQEVITNVDEEGNESVVTKEYNIITKDELSTLFKFILNSPDFVISILNQGEIDVVGLVTSDEVINLLKESNLLKGVIAGVFISLTENIDMITLPYEYDDPERWITDGEVDALIDAIVALKETKTADGEPLINTLLNGNIDLNTILDISTETISEMYKSKVLKYTISGALTTVGGEDLPIVVPGVSCELVGVKTSKGKIINIISEKEIIDIFDQLDNIIKIEDGNVTVLYSKIFNEKAKILKSYTIQATIMKLLINMGDGEDSFIKIPESYVTEFNSFVDAENEEKLTNNKWFISNNVTKDPENPVIDDELYILFNAIEALLGEDQKEKDENGNTVIKESFSLDSIGDSIEIKQDSVDTITSSIILNSTLTDVITSSLATPLSVLVEDVIIKTELKSLIDSLFKVLSKAEGESITLNDVENIDLNTVKIKRKDIEEVYIKSEIFMTTFSTTISSVENVFVPKDVTVLVEVLENGEIKSVHRIIDETLSTDPNDNEFDYLLECLFEFLGKTEGEDEVLNLTEFTDVEDFKLNNQNIPVISQSAIFSASMSNILCTEEKLIIPEKDASGTAVSVLTDIVDYDLPKYILTQVELNNTLITLLDMFGEKNAEGEKELGLVIDLSSFKINNEVKEKILDSAVLSATISRYILNEGIGIVPDEDYIIEKISILNDDKIEEGFNVVEAELDNFMTSSIVLFGTDGELNINDIKLGDFVIDDSNVEYLDDSYIINATTTNELIKVNDLVIPEKDSLGNEITLRHNIALKEKTCATMNDIVEFMKEMLEIFGGAINPSNLSSFELKLVKGEDLDGVLWATFSKQLISNNNILIPYSTGENISSISVLAFDDTNGVSAVSKELVTVTETNNFKDSMINVLSTTDELVINLEGGIKVEDMIFEEDDVNANEGGIFSSNIFTATVAKSIIGLESLKVPSIVKVPMIFYGNAELVDSLNKDQVKSLFNSLFVTTNGQSIKINDFKTDNMILPTDKVLVAKMLESLIVAATMSDEIVVKSNGSTVILEDFMENYGYDNDSDGNLDFDTEKYISIDELTNLIYALTKGFDKTLISNLKFDDLKIPTDDKVDAIVGSGLIQATISREIMKRQGGISVEASICETAKLYNSETNVIVISKDEIKLLIEGFNALTGGSSNSTFDNIQIGIDELVGNITKVTAVAESSILRSIISDTLKGNNYYLILGIGEPQSMNVYKTFENAIVETDTLFTEDQIMIIAF